MSDLDAFFAMKDKKKSKARPNYFTPDELFRNMEDTAKCCELSPRTRKVDQQYHNSLPSTVSVQSQIELNAAKAQVDETNEDEWRDFDDERRKDYSGLKIGQLVLQEQEEDCKDEGGDHVDEFIEPTYMTNGGDAFGDAVPNTQGPWKKITPFELECNNVIAAAGGLPDNHIDTDPQSEPMSEPDKPAKKVYVPPALRKSQGDILEGAIVKKPNVREAPDLSSDVFFPSLGSAAIKTQKHKKKTSVDT